MNPPSTEQKAVDIEATKEPAKVAETQVAETQVAETQVADPQVIDVDASSKVSNVVVVVKKEGEKPKKLKTLKKKKKAAAPKQLPSSKNRKKNATPSIATPKRKAVNIVVADDPKPVAAKQHRAAFQQKKKVREAEEEAVKIREENKRKEEEALVNKIAAQVTANLETKTKAIKEEVMEATTKLVEDSETATSKKIEDSETATAKKLEQVDDKLNKTRDTFGEIGLKLLERLDGKNQREIAAAAEPRDDSSLVARTTTMAPRPAASATLLTAAQGQRPMRMDPHQYQRMSNNVPMMPAVPNINVNMHTPYIPQYYNNYQQQRANLQGPSPNDVDMSQWGWGMGMGNPNNGSGFNGPNNSG